ncbi:MAG: GNAT family N-acetyltransferase [Prochloraceae cyanobacterium]|nr:GNAT family N-acetyltransferase [Prochloraceae cyanobacterium]
MKFEYSSLCDLKESKQLGTILCQSFGTPNSFWQDYVNNIGPENFRILRQNGEIIGGLAIYPMAQWYGGLRVPMAGIAAVGIAPEYRGKGAANRLMDYLIEELKDSKFSISVLYPATQRLYQKIGYERAGSYCIWEIPIANINTDNYRLSISRVDPQEYQVFENIYCQQAQNNNGNLERHSSIWKRITERSEDREVYAYLLGDLSEPEGYIIFTQEREKEEKIIKVRDKSLLTTAAIQDFWSFLAAHRSMFKKACWKSSPLDPLSLFLPEQKAKIHHQEYWMLRIIDVASALMQRGYPLGIETELHLEVKDEQIHPNNSKFCLQVSQGKAEVIKGGKGEFKIDIKSLSCLYSGLFNPAQIKLIGHLDATFKALSTANLLFSSPVPWMADFF